MEYFMCERCGKVYDGDETPLSGDCECGGYLEDAMKCEICGEIFIPDDYNCICDECLEKNASVDTVFELYGDLNETIEINDFLANVFSKDEIEEILLKELRTMGHSATKLAENYLMADKYSYAECLASARAKKK